jgi:hypothetical protein
VLAGSPSLGLTQSFKTLHTFTIESDGGDPQRRSDGTKSANKPVHRMTAQWSRQQVQTPVAGRHR